MFGLDIGDKSLPDLVDLFEAAASGDALLEAALAGGVRVCGDDFCLVVGGSFISGRVRLFTCLVADCFGVGFNGFVLGVSFCFREVDGSESELTTISS